MHKCAILGCRGRVHARAYDNVKGENLRLFVI